MNYGQLAPRRSRTKVVCAFVAQTTSTSAALLGLIDLRLLERALIDEVRVNKPLLALGAVIAIFEASSAESGPWTEPSE